MPYFDDDFVLDFSPQDPPRDEDWFEDEDYFPGGVAVELGDGIWDFSFIATTWGYYVFGSGPVDGGTQLSDGSWLVPGGAVGSMTGRDDDFNGIPDGVTFVPYGGT